jgi:peptide/nickel transport system permease protein
LWLPLFPASAAIPEGTSPLASPKYLIMPIAALALVLFGYVARMVRASMIEELRSYYTRTAVLKGLPMRTVVRRHVLRNALLPAITVITNQVSWLVGGLVVVENVFNYPGIGQLLLQAALDKDVPLLETTVMIVAAALILANLAADVLYSVLNPRIRVHSRAG